MMKAAVCYNYLRSKEIDILPDRKPGKPASADAYLGEKGGGIIMSILKNIYRMGVICCLSICMLAAAMTIQVKAAEANTAADSTASDNTASDNTPSDNAATDNTASDNTYTVTYRPGKIARFSDQLYAGYVAAYGEERVSRSEATGSIKITVTAGVPCPAVPDASDLIFDDAHKGKYYVKTEWRPTQETVTENGDYVVDYGALTDSVEYAIRFVDAQSGEDVATPVITMGNVNDKITYTAKTIQGYAYDSYVKQLTLTADSAGNEIRFNYTSTQQPTTQVVQIPGDTITNTTYEQGPSTTVNETVTVPGGTTTTPADNNAAADNTAPAANNTTQNQNQNQNQNQDQNQNNANPAPDQNENNVNIPDEEVPLADQPEGTGSTDGVNQPETVQATEEITDGEVPLADKPSEDLSSSNMPLILGSAFAGFLLLAGGFLYVMKKKGKW